MLVIWHNPDCSKSCATLALIEENGRLYEERRYLTDPPTPEELERVLEALAKEPWEIARLEEALAAELGLAERPHDRTAWIEVLCANPILIERPIVFTTDGRAAIGRPPEAVVALFAPAE